VCFQMGHSAGCLCDNLGRGKESDAYESGKMSKKKKPVCKLVGEDGNVFAIIGRVSKALKSVGLKEQAREFTQKAFKSESYDAVLQLAMKYVDVE